MANISENINNIASAGYPYVTTFASNAESTIVVYTNETSTPLNAALVRGTETVEPTTAVVGDILNHTITLTNDGTVDAQNVVFNHDINPSTNFVVGSVTLNGVAVTPTTTNPLSVDVGNIPPSSEAVITFQTIVSSVPDDNIITESGTFNYNYLLNPDDPSSTIQADGSTNAVDVTINAVTPSLTATKTADKAFVTLNDILTYSIVLTNTGMDAIQNIQFNDELPANTELVPNSIIVTNDNVIIMQNIGSATDERVSVVIDNLDAGKSATVTFKVKIVE